MTTCVTSPRAALYEAGDSVETITESMGKATASIWKVLHERRIPMRPPTT